MVRRWVPRAPPQRACSAHTAPAPARRKTYQRGAAHTSPPTSIHAAVISAPLCPAATLVPWQTRRRCPPWHRPLSSTMGCAPPLAGPRHRQPPLAPHGLLAASLLTPPATLPRFCQPQGVMHWALNVTDLAPGNITVSIVDGSPPSTVEKRAWRPAWRRQLHLFALRSVAPAAAPRARLGALTPLPLRCRPRPLCSGPAVERRRGGRRL